MLLNLECDTDCPSSEFRETEHVYAVMLGSNEKWIQLTAQQHIDYFHSLLKFQCKKKKKKQKEKKVSSDRKNDAIDEIKKKILESKGLPGNLKFGDTVRLITIVDIGGQPGYVHLLPILNFSNSCDLSRLTINFVVHDLTKSLDDPVMVRYKKNGREGIKPYERQYTHKDLIKQLMSVTTTISSSSKAFEPQTITSLIGFIGTHKDELDGNCTDIVRSFDKQLEELVKEQGRANNTLNAGGKFKYIFVVDYKSDKDNIAQRIRHSIEALPERKGNTLPIAWMILELEVKRFCENEKLPCISLKKYCEIAREKAKITDEKSISFSLDYFHVVGIFLFYSALQDADIIVVNHQWFYNQLSKLVCFRLEDISLSTVQQAEQFESQGILPKCTLVNSIDIGIFKKTYDYSINFKTHHFIKLLHDMKILATFKDRKDKEELCYLPYFRPFCNVQDEKYKYLLLEPLLIRILPGYIPIGFFSHLAVNLFQSNCCNPMHGEKQYRNVIVLLYKEKYCLKLCDKVRYIEVQVRHSTYCQKESMYPLFEVLQKCLDDMCKTWNIEVKKLQYGFICHYCEHMIVFPSMKDPKSCNMEKTEAQSCENCQKSSEIGKRHRLWIEGNSNQELIIKPQYFIINS